MKERTFAAQDYTYGFNGMEKDDEMNGEGNSYNFGARLYDTRIGRWLAVDPLTDKYPNLSPYNFVSNKPIIAVDIDGRDYIIKITPNKNGKGGTIKIISTVYLQGDVPSTLSQKDVQRSFNKMVKNRTYQDGQNGVWDVEFDVKFVEGQTKKQSELKAGENILDFDKNENYNSSHAHSKRSGLNERTTSDATVGVKDLASSGGVEIQITNMTKTTIHETLHLLGLSDRYTEFGAVYVRHKKVKRGWAIAHEEFEDDMMGTEGFNISQVHIDNWAIAALNHTVKDVSNNTFLATKMELNLFVDYIYSSSTANSGGTLIPASEVKGMKELERKKFKVKVREP